MYLPPACRILPAFSRERDMGGCRYSDATACSTQVQVEKGPISHFARMIPNCLAYARRAKDQGRPIVGLLCEFTPRELILAAGDGGVPVSLCGGSAKTIPPAEQILPANLCPLIKSTFGYHLTRSNPFLEMADLVVAETTCDGKTKMYELMGEKREMLLLELPHVLDNAGGLERWHAQLLRLKEHLENRFHSPITDAKLRAAIATMNRERHLRRQLAGLMRQDRPPLTGRQLLDLRSHISGIEEDLQQYQRAYDHYAAQQTPASSSNGHKPPVRVLMTGVPLVQGAELMMDVVENAGGLVVALENCAGLKPILEDVDAQAADPLKALAEKYYHIPCSVMTRNTRRLETLRQLAAQYRPQCIVELVWQACLTYDVESHFVRRLAETELHLPYLRIETDYSPSDTVRVSTRLEALYETVRDRGRS
jgi:benzoyl-CoA reductase/2-hydroxyglutaryl-CoA dehydratase subunit BcrC/BadD/HgdB